MSARTYRDPISRIFDRMYTQGCSGRVQGSALASLVNTRARWQPHFLTIPTASSFVRPRFPSRPTRRTLQIMALPPLPSPFEERLLPTAADAVDAATAEAIQAFCEASPEVEAAYVCMTERTRDGAQPERALRLSVKLLSPVDTPEDTRTPSLELAQRFSRTNPKLMRHLGYGVLADAL
jgi:hypothetical protein